MNGSGDNGAGPRFVVAAANEYRLLSRDPALFGVHADEMLAIGRPQQRDLAGVELIVYIKGGARRIGEDANAADLRIQTARTCTTGLPGRVKRKIVIRDIIRALRLNISLGNYEKSCFAKPSIQQLNRKSEISLVNQFLIAFAIESPVVRVEFLACYISVVANGADTAYPVVRHVSHFQTAMDLPAKPLAEDSAATSRSPARGLRIAPRKSAC